MDTQSRFYKKTLRLLLLVVARKKKKIMVFSSFLPFFILFFLRTQFLSFSSLIAELHFSLKAPFPMNLFFFLSPSPFHFASCPTIYSKGIRSASWFSFLIFSFHLFHWSMEIYQSRRSTRDGWHHVISASFLFLFFSRCWSDFSSAAASFPLHTCKK